MVIPMNKRIIAFITVVVIIIVGIIGFISFNNRTVTIITLDINPSIELRLDKKQRVKKAIPLNEDGKDIINSNIKGKSLDKSLNIIAQNLIDKDYVKGKEPLDIILYSKSSITNNKEFKKKLTEVFTEKSINPNIIVIKNISNEDKKLAQKYDISPAKAAYINTIIKNNKNISAKNLVNRSVNELNETKTTGNYCEEGYTLEGDFCLKEIKTKKASSGMICPDGYYEYNSKCYKEVGVEETDELTCRENFTLSGKKCTRIVSIDATPSKYTCSQGEKKTKAEMNLTDTSAGDAKDIVCVDTSNATHPQSPCELNDGTEYTVAGGVCYWHRAPIIEAGCPGKIEVNGFCWDNASSILICAGARDGRQYKSRDEYCEDSIRYITPTVSEYKCDKDYTLNGNKCEKKETEQADHKKTCPTNYTLVNNDRCINYNKTKEKVSGWVCEGENTRLIDSKCVVYEIIEAKHN